MAEPPLPQAPAPAPAPEPEARWLLIRDLGVFVAKVGLEAARDVALIPLALAAGAAGLLFQPRRPDRYFRAVQELGQRFDDWLDLFGKGPRGETPPKLPTVDALVARVEAVLAEQQRRGGVSATAKDAVDRALDAVQHAVAGRRARGDPKDAPRPDAGPPASR